ncbi:MULTISPECIES: hypothetical protein [unclassified Cellulophaga]|uniref:hypothetical protein n=1 Tax=unclassified Cellulophaga TaxID=2634405 RepID=UPI0026E3AA86|nr:MULTISPECIES: hypothetical protein [unclassified Cellulophaga]MDO6492768.1 hypothetical protein [Cellulophaga sp. 2_MG-2023]MDO6496272.1 hypothetical protein [Cellulophaga sp. 3_MG-2023]
MKKTIYLFALVTFGLFMNSCSSDDDSGSDNVIGSFLKIDDNKTDFVLGIAEDYGAYNEEGEEGIYNIDLSLLSTGFTFEDQELNGTGIGIYFEIFSSTPNKLAPGVYEYDANAQTALIFDDATLFEYTEDEEKEIDLVSGTITIIKSEIGYYELTFNGEDELGRVISGSFSGNVEYIKEIEEED